MMEKAYAIHVGGGLANKMFHLAFGMSLKYSGKHVVYDDFSFVPEFEHDKIDVADVFPHLDLERMPHGMYHFGGYQGKLGALLRRISVLTGEKYYISHNKKYDSSISNMLVKPGYIIGSFQNEKYFQDYSDKIRNSFQFKPFKDEKNTMLSNELSNCQSIAIHVRKGDGYATWKQFVGTCNADYYKRAVELIMGKVHDPHFFVFTDSVEWVQENLSWLEYKLIDWNPPYGEGTHCDMQLMSIAKHNIIANSTYSWWGAWLNVNPQKIVIAPKDWYSPIVKEDRDIVPKEWIKM